VFCKNVGYRRRVALVGNVLLGALVPLHVRFGWRRRTNLVTGSLMTACNALLILTAFGLYYFGSETLRLWASRLHIGVGIGLPFLFLLHVLVGRRSS